jgi:hypothetical protein
MKVLIEASEAYRNQTGIGRFSRELIAHLPASVQPRFSPIDYATRIHKPSRRNLFQRLQHFGQHLTLTQGAITVAAYREQPDIVHSLSFFTPLLIRHIPIVSTIFDLAYFDLPDETDPFWGAYARVIRARLQVSQDEAHSATLTAASALRDAGLPLRDVGDLLGLTHQRIAQLMASRGEVGATPDPST